MVTVTLDFNTIDDDGTVMALAEDADGPVSSGQTVVARDGEGNHCRALVTDVRNRLIRLSPNLNTWVDGGTCRTG